MDPDQLFVKIANKEIPSQEMYSDEKVYALHDINPGAATHIFVIPRRHIKRITEAKGEDALLLGRMMLVENKITRQESI